MRDPLPMRLLYVHGEALWSPVANLVRLDGSPGTIGYLTSECHWRRRRPEARRREVEIRRTGRRNARSQVPGSASKVELSRMGSGGSMVARLKLKEACRGHVYVPLRLPKLSHNLPCSKPKPQERADRPSIFTPPSPRPKQAAPSPVSPKTPPIPHHPSQTPSPLPPTY